MTNVPAALVHLEDDIVSFFEDLGTQVVDLTTDDVTLDFIYHAPLSIDITGFPELTCSASGINLFAADSTTVLRTIADAPIIAQDDVLGLTIEVAEDYGNGTTCAVDEGTITIFDAVGVDAEEPVQLELNDGLASYNLVVGTPNVSTGQIVDGLDRSFQKSFSVTAEVEGLDPVNETEWVLVEGRRTRTGTFVSATTDEIPLLVLHDPPGSQSYAYLEEGTTTCKTFSSKRVAGGGAGLFRDVAIGFKANAGPAFGAAFLVENGAGLLIQGRTVGGRETSRIRDKQDNFELCVTTTETWATSDDPSAIQDDIFVGVALNLLFAKDEIIAVNNACKVDRSEGLAADLDPKDAFRTTYTYSKSFIESVMIPEIDRLIDLGGENGGDQLLSGKLPGGVKSPSDFGGPEELRFGLANPGKDETYHLTLDDARNNWQAHIDTNVVRIENGLEDEDTKNYSFSGGLVYEHSQATEHTEVKFEDVNISWGYSENDIGVILTGGGYDQNAGVTFEVYGETINEKSEEETNSKTVGWVFDDGDGQDYFTVDVGSDPVYGTPVFGLVSGRTSNPCEGRGAGDGGSNLTQCRDNPKISVSPPARLNVADGEPAQFTVTITNDSESDEQREISLISLAENNLNGAIVKANGNVIGATNPQLYLIPAGASVSVNVTVERPSGSSVYDFEDLALTAYAEDEYEIWRADMRADFLAQETALIRAQFVAPSASVSLSELDQLWSYSAGDPPVQMKVSDYEFDCKYMEGDLSKLRIGTEYRRQGDELWTKITERTARDLQAEGAPSFTTSWMPERDGDYEVRAYTECDAPTNRVTTTPIIGAVDMSAPLVFAPEPRDGSLGIGDVAQAVFSEDLVCASAPAAVINRLDAAGNVVETLENVQVSCEKNAINVAPEGGWDTAENGARYQVRLVADDGLMDEMGNRVENDVTWQFIIQRSEFSFNPVRLDAATTRGAERTLQVNLANGKAEPVAFAIESTLRLEHMGADGLPSGEAIELEPSVTEGEIAAAANYPVQFDLPPTLAVGTWRGQMTASGTSGTQNLGTVPFLAEVEVGCASPAWHIGPAAYGYDMSIVTELHFEGVASVSNEDMIAAYVGDKLRGLANPGPDGKVYLTIFSNLDEGEIVTFKAWHAGTCTLSDITKSTPFKADSFVELGALEPGALQAQTIQMTPGWSWFSFNRAAETVILEQAFEGLSLTEGDMVTNSAGQSSIFINDMWAGDLTELRLGQGYKANLADGGVLQLAGPSADPATMVQISEGINWVGYLPEEPMQTGEALSRLQAMPGDYIKSKSAFAYYVEGPGWVGSLDVMEPGQGYVLRAGKAGQLQYTEPREPTKELRDRKFKNFAMQHVKAVTERAVDPVVMTIKDEAFSHSMILTGEAKHNDVSPEYLRVNAYIGEKLRGSAKMTYVDGIDAYRFFMVIHGEEEEEVTFRLINEQSDESIDVEYKLTFSAEASHGSPDEPVVIQEAGADLPSIFELDQNYPNPFNPSTTIRYALPETSDVEMKVYDILGREVMTLVRSEQQKAGRYEVVFDASRLASGIYMYTIKAGAFKEVKKMILVK